MKTLLVYYSRTGTTKIVAEAIAKEIKCDVEELIDKKSRAGPFGWLGGGGDAAQKKLTEINPVSKDASKYDLVIIGTPTWAGRMAPAVRTYLLQAKPKNIAFFSTMGGENTKSTLDDFTESFGKPKAYLPIQTKNARNQEFVKEKLLKFLQEIND